jgi:hypothetical protein
MWHSASLLCERYRITEALYSMDAAARTAAEFNVVRLAGPLPLVPAEPISAAEWPIRVKVSIARNLGNGRLSLVQALFHCRLCGDDSQART